MCGWMTYNQRRLQQYILLCCQRPEGGECERKLFAWETLCFLIRLELAH